MKNLKLAAAVATTLAIPLETVAAVDMFLELKGIPGESQDAQYKGTIDVLAWSWGLAEDGKSTACLQDISVTKWHDASSPELMEAVSNGSIIPEGTLYVRKSGDKPLTYIILEMNNLRATALSLGGSGGEDRLTENVSFRFDEVDGTYVPQAPGGAPGEPMDYFILNKCK